MAMHKPAQAGHGHLSLLNLNLSCDTQRARDSLSLIRSKWLSHPLEHPEYRHLFVIGGSNWPGHIRQDELWLPSDDAYRSLASKVLDAFQYALDHPEEVGTFAYYLKSDDDTFVCIDQLIAWLRRGSLPLTHVYAGQPQQPEKNVSYWLSGSNIYDPNYAAVFNSRLYKPYMLGGGYLLLSSSTDTV
jgi:hypothetical protein